jgi:hypothetical protein
MSDDQGSHCRIVRHRKSLIVEVDISIAAIACNSDWIDALLQLQRPELERWMDGGWKQHRTNFEPIKVSKRSMSYSLHICFSSRRGSDKEATRSSSLSVIEFKSPLSSQDVVVIGARTGSTEA